MQPTAPLRASQEKGTCNAPNEASEARKHSGKIVRREKGNPNREEGPVVMFLKCGMQFCLPMPGTGQAKVRTCPGC